MSDLGSQVYNLQMQHMVSLWTIDFNPCVTFDSPEPAIIHLTSYKNAGNTDIVYDGNTYSFVGIQGSGFRSELNGQLPEPIITIDKNSLYALPQYQTIKQAFYTQTGQQFFDWRAAKVTRVKTTSNYLTNPAFGDRDDYVVDQVNRTTKDVMEIKLSVSIGADRVNNLSVQELSANRCSLRYRSYNGGFKYMDEAAGGCPYGNPTTKSNWSAVPGFGTRYYTQSDGDTTNPQLDICSYSVKGCQLRFDPNEEGYVLPFTGIYTPAGKTN